jgi:hypothetical protein
VGAMAHGSVVMSARGGVGCEGVWVHGCDGTWSHGSSSCWCACALVAWVLWCMGRHDGVGAMGRWHVGMWACWSAVTSYVDMLTCRQVSGYKGTVY